MKYHYPITIEQNFEPEWVNDPTTWLVEGAHQATMLPDLPRTLLRAYGYLNGQVTELTLSCQTPLGSMILRLQDSRHLAKQKGDKISDIGG